MLTVVVQGQEQAVELPYATDRCVIPVEDGLVVWNQGQEHLLYFILPSGEIQELFYAPCMCSDSAVNVFNDYIYLSIERYEGYDIFGIGLEHFSNDNIQGSYKINWRTGKSVKCSDQVYSGLFIFGDAGLIGCEQKTGKIVLMDFDYNVIKELK